MPNGKTHDRATLVFSPIVIAVVVAAVINYKYDIYLGLLFVGLYFFSSFMFNGDLDVISKPYNRWGFLRFIWKPYQKLFTHRSIWTHGIIIGTVVRLSYLTILLSPGIYLYFSEISSLFNNNLQLFLIVFLGLESGSMLHTTLDFIY